MRAKSLLLLIAAIGLAWMVYRGIELQKNNRIGDDLARRIDRELASSNAADSTAQARAGLIRLDDQLLAEREGKRDWLIKRENGSAAVVVPFQPTRAGGVIGSNDRPAVARESLKTKAVSRFSNPGFVGADACRECHQQKHAGFIETSHHRTSGPAVAAEMPGALTAPLNRLAVPESTLEFTIHAIDEKPYQKIDFGNWECDVPMDIYTGSNKLGQSYLFWVGDALFQNHISYTANYSEWIPSPGYPERLGVFTREVSVRCLECHATFIERVAPPNHFDPESAVWGISCERCHGPGKQHVEFHHANPNLREGSFIANPGELSREAQLDICGQCHSGSYVPRTAPFAFRPGDRLIDHRKPHPQNADDAGSIHTSNQLARLQQSVCFQQSEMTCATCHNPHVFQRDNLNEFSQRCQDCHQAEQCGMHDQLGAALTTNCIDCHMPTGDLEQMQLETTEGRLSPPMIDHLIRIDREATEKYLREENTSATLP